MNCTFDLSNYDERQLHEMPYREFLETDYWKSVAAAVKARDGKKCVVCNSARKIAAHHRTYAHHGAEHLHLGDLTTLCEQCHTRHHFPSPPAKVIVKTVTQIRHVAAPALPVGESVGYWAFLSKGEKRFYRKAAIKLHRKAKKLCLLGRQAVLDLLHKADHPESQAPTAPASVPSPKLNGYIVVGDLASVDADMPPGDEIVLTKDVLNKCRANGSFTTATLRAFGLDSGNLQHGWAKELVGKSFQRAAVYEALRGRHLYSPSTFKHRRKRERLAALTPPAASPVPC